MARRPILASHGPDMSELRIERLGGLGGFGLPGSGLQGQGTVQRSQLTPRVRAAVDELFASADQTHTRAADAPDSFRYRITRVTRHGPQTVVVPESEVPEQLLAHVRDELR